MFSASRPAMRRLRHIDMRVRSEAFPNATSLARELEVCRRTIYRDLVFLRDSWDAPLSFCAKKNGYYYADPDYRLPNVRLTEGELVAIFLAERLLTQYRHAAFLPDVVRAFRKITDALVEEISIDWTHLDTTLSVRGPPAGRTDVSTFRTLHRAIRQCRRVKLVYWTASRDETTERLVDPYHLTAIDGEWYLIGYCHLREEVRMFVPSRIRTLRETGVPFDRPADFSLSSYLDSSFRTVRGRGPLHHVRLRFSPAAARYVREREWHPSQRLEARSDGSVILRLQVSHLFEIKRWVLSWGAECEVLKPEELKREVRQELAHLMKYYTG